MSGEQADRITDHAYRPDRQSQWVTGRCDLCGEPEKAHEAAGRPDEEGQR